MTEFTKPKFSVPLGGKAFGEGYDRAFKKKRIHKDNRLAMFAKVLRPGEIIMWNGEPLGNEIERFGNHEEHLVAHRAMANLIVDKPMCCFKITNLDGKKKQRKGVEDDRAFKVKRIKPYIAKVGNQIIVSPNDSYVAIEKQRKGKKK